MKRDVPGSSGRGELPEFGGRSPEATRPRARTGARDGAGDGAGDATPGEAGGRVVSPGWMVPNWPVPPTVRALSTTRLGGASRPPYASLNLGAHVGDAAMAVAKNRRSLREAAGLPEEPVWLSQVHGTRVADLDTELRASVGMHGPASDGERGVAERRGGAAVLAAADAACTRQVGRVCAILTADCLPVLMAAAGGDRVAAAHAGWRGLVEGVLEATVKSLRCPPRELLVWLGPAIGPEHFEIGPEVREAFIQSDAAGATWVKAAGAAVAAAASSADAAGAAAGLDSRSELSWAAVFQLNERGRFMADLYALARRRLERLGVEHIYGGGECTFGQREKYFSHRRDGITGRQASLIWLQPPPGR